jgi:hypothetical protein
MRLGACGCQYGRAACRLGLQQRQVQMLRQHAEQAQQRGAVEEVAEDCVLVVGRQVEQRTARLLRIVVTFRDLGDKKGAREVLQLRGHKGTVAHEDSHLHAGRARCSAHVGRGDQTCWDCLTQAMLWGAPCQRESEAGSSFWCPSAAWAQVRMHQAFMSAALNCSVPLLLFVACSSRNMELLAAAIWGILSRVTKYGSSPSLAMWVAALPAHHRLVRFT